MGAPKRRRWLFIATPIGVALTFLVVAVATAPGGSSLARALAAASARDQRLLATIPQHGYVLGNPSAAVTVTEIADLQCPQCGTYSLTTFPRLVDEYVRTGKVKMVFDDVAFIGRDSLTAGRAAMAAARQRKLWNFVDAFFYRQGVENSGYVTDAFLASVGRAAHLDAHRLILDRHSPLALAAVMRQIAYAEANGFGAAPSFLITRRGAAGDTRVIGYALLHTAIQRALAGWGAA